MASAEDAGDEPIDDVDAWLERNAAELPIRKAKGTESWKRATSEASEADLESREGIGRWAIRLPDGEDVHELVIVKQPDGDYVGACDCQGHRMHSHPCAHLCALAQLDVLEDVVPVDRGRAQELAFGVDAEVVEHGDDATTQTADQVIDDGDDVQEAEVVDVEDSSPNSGDEPRGSDGENRPAPPTEPANPPDTPSDAFAGELPDVPDQYVMELGGSTYIRRAGYARLARAEGFRLSLEEIVGAHENEWTHSKYRAEVLDEDGDVVASDVGTAHVDSEDLSDAEANLDELAATRAATRALAWATGEGINAVEEVAADEAQRAQGGGR